MSTVLVSNLISDAALKIGDPRKRRVKEAEWLAFFNQSARELCGKAGVLQLRSLFNLGAQDAYHYPDEMTQMTGLEVSETPDDDRSWQRCREMFQDEWRARIDRYYPDATLPEFYFADNLGFYLYPQPSATIENGGRITYFGLPDEVSDPTDEYQLPQISRDYVARRMVVHGLKARNRHAEAESELREWLVDVEGLQDRMEDRSDDRRSSLRPRRNPYAGMR